MGQKEKLYEKIKKNPKNVSYDDIDRLLVEYGGFERRNGKGSHWVYKHPLLKGIEDYVTIPKKRPVKKIYILKALRLFEEVLELE